MSRFVATRADIVSDELSAGALRVWLTGHDPVSGEERGAQRLSPDADLVLDGTINHPKSFSLAALLHPELAVEFEALQDRLRDRILQTWLAELNARRGHGGVFREGLARIEVVELRHRRSRALDPHVHRHLWLNVKVQGEDGRWSNVDSRVAMKLQTVINAEGELAARTDPEWRAALDRYGLTLTEDGEIAQLVGAVRPLSRRSAQIEANRARLIGEWSAQNAGASPSQSVLKQIDRRAWALSRPEKPAVIDEGGWEAAVRDEIRTALSGADDDNDPPVPSSVRVGTLDLDELADAAVVDADERSRSSAGRFSLFDLRAGAIRALARTGVVADRAAMDGVILRATELARTRVLRLVRGGGVPGHVKGFMATSTVRAKIRITGLLDAVARPGMALPSERFRQLIAREAVQLDGAQEDAAAAIAGAAGLVAVAGPAGAGKTTMLRAAHRALAGQRRRMLVVAPTRKAASVAARETGAAATSIHALLLDHGYRWTTGPQGQPVWSRLAVGDVDSVTGVRYEGPSRFALRASDRIVVDEAGMVDLDVANLLLELAAEYRVGVVMVGDPDQAVPVGHAGAMSTAMRHANQTIELDTIHRFRDPTYAALTLRLRHPRDLADARDIAHHLHTRGSIQTARDREEAIAMILDGYFTAAARGDRVAVITATNGDADTLNTAIQTRRVDAGELHATVVAAGQDGQRILVGDTVQTRRNDTRAGVENRAQWIVHAITPAGVDLTSSADSGQMRRISHEYALDHLHLAYASTVHGIQGDTVDTAIVAPDVDAAGLYVGLTRGRHHNTAIVTAPHVAAAIDRLAHTMLRRAEELTLADATHAAQTELHRTARPAPSESNLER